MRWNSLYCVAQSFLLSVVIATVLLIGGCDLFGGNSDSGPNWVGNWEAVDAKPDSVEYPPDDTRILFSLTRDSIKSYVKFSGNECSVDATEILKIDGNVVTTEGGEEEQTETRLEVSDNTLTITPLSSEAELEEVTAESVDNDPADILNCSSSSASGAVRQHALDRRLWPRE